MALPRFLRRHYPHQVQGVRSTIVRRSSQPGGSPALISRSG